MYIARKCSDERAHKVVSHGYFPFECSRRKVKYDVIRIVGENRVLIGAFPGIEILLDKRPDVFRRRLDSHSLHISSFSTVRLPRRRGQVYTRGVHQRDRRGTAPLSPQAAARTFPAE